MSKQEQNIDQFERLFKDKASEYTAKAPKANFKQIASQSKIASTNKLLWWLGASFTIIALLVSSLYFLLPSENQSQTRQQEIEKQEVVKPNIVEQTPISETKTTPIREEHTPVKQNTLNKKQEVKNQAEASPVETIIAHPIEHKDTTVVEKHKPKVTRQKPTEPQDLQQLYLQSIQNEEGDSLFRDKKR